MHRDISNYNERGRKNAEADNVIPQSTIVEAKGTEDGCAGDFDVQAVFVVDQGEVFDFVDDETFEAVVEDRKLRVISRE